FLRERLPGYMVPDQLLVLESFPLSGNGKIDRDELSRLLDGTGADTADEPPREGIESELAELWSDLLDCPVRGRSQSFFALGGDSITATRMIGQVRARYGAEVPLRLLFDRPTVADLAAAVEEQGEHYEEGVL
ncbi:phosphopantetheine-binding protein, partial [Nonomuraea sp. NPDC046802]|uniref:phosphopantetheine-binding protein n=1 Tax=Nonomuraea sp. NPDC046802 TaxID=3154919 RepID=UPI003403EFEF